MVRPIDTDVLRDICAGLAMDNYGFIYVKDHKNVITDQYEQANTGLKYKSSLSLSDIEEGLQQIADQEYTSFERLRPNAYFLNPFEKREGRQIGDELQSLFSTDIVLHKKRLESRFDIAPTDVDFFAQHLIDENYMTRIPAGQRDYFVGGSKLKEMETTRDISLETQLKNKSDARGKISHRELEEEIDVAATDSVIDYLQQHDFIIDLDGEYLVQEALEEFAESLAERIEDTVAEEFAESEYVLHKPEYEQVVENAINDISTILKEARSVKREIIDETKDALSENLELEERPRYNMVVVNEHTLDGQGFEEFVVERARAVKNQVARSDETTTKPGEWKAAGEKRISDLQVGRTERSQDFIRDEITERYEELVDEDW